MRNVGLDPKTDAVLTLDDLDALIHEAIIAYQNRKHTGVGGVPARIWRDKIAIRKRHIISDVAALDRIVGRVDTAVLTTAGVRYKNMVFHDPDITSDLLDDMLRNEDKRSQSDKTFASGRVKVVFKWNPADAGSILIWNRNAQPNPRYVVLPNVDRDFFDGLSFWHWEKIREFADKQDLEYSSEAGRWKARNELRKRWESFSGKLPLRQTTDERRGLAFSQGTFDDSTRNEGVDLDHTTIIETEAEPSTDGRNEPDGVSDEIYAAMIDGDDGKIKGRKPSERSIRKSRITKERNTRDAKEAERKREVREWIDAATGAPDDSAAKTLVADDDLPTGEAWGDEVPTVDGKDVPLADDADLDGLPRGEDWGDQE